MACSEKKSDQSALPMCGFEQLFYDCPSRAWRDEPMAQNAKIHKRVILELNSIQNIFSKKCDLKCYPSTAL